MRQIVEKTWEYNLGVSVAFIDLQKAFDSVPRSRLWKCLEEEYGVVGRMINAIKSLYEVCICKVRTGHENEKWFEVKTGVKQGSVLSPLLFIAYLDKVIKEFKAGWDKDNEWGILAYADDIAFWSVVEEDMREGLERWNLCFERAGLKMNKEKTVFMRVNRERNRGNLDIQVEGRYLKEVEKFEYLGSVFGGAGGVEKDIAERIGKYGRSVNCFYPLLKNQNVPLQANRVIFESILTPILTYGAECWTTTTVTRSRIQVVEMRSMRAMIG